MKIEEAKEVNEAIKLLNAEQPFTHHRSYKPAFVEEVEVSSDKLNPNHTYQINIGGGSMYEYDENINIVYIYNSGQMIISNDIVECHDNSVSNPCTHPAKYVLCEQLKALEVDGKSPYMMLVMEWGDGYSDNQTLPTPYRSIKAFAV